MRHLRGVLVAIIALGVLTPGYCDVSPLAGLLGAFPGSSGWRFRLPQATWPANFWQGGDYPAAGVSPLTPATWGKLHFSPDPLSDPAVRFDAAEVTVPLTEVTPGVNGLLGVEEWADAATVVYRYGAGEQLAMMVKHSDTHLFVALAAPAELAVRQGAVAELCWAGPRAEPETLDVEHRLLRATGGAGGQSLTQTGHGREGRWVLSGTADREDGRGAVNNSGDGAWAFLGAEFSVPLASLGGTPERLPQAIPFLARLQLGGSGPRLPQKPQPPRETLLWPDGRSSYARVGKSLFSERPDLWGKITLNPLGYDALVIPRLQRAMRLDGHLLPGEWEGAAEARYALPGGQWRVLRLVRDEEHLYVAARWSLGRGLRANEQVRLYLDRHGDGGLKPRPDDMTCTLTAAQPDRVVVQRYRDGLWQADDREPVTGFLTTLSPYDSQAEFALPLPPDSDEQLSPALAVEVSYDLPRP